MHVRTLITLTTLELTLGLSPPLATAQKIYWTEAGVGTIRGANLDGSNVEDVVTGLSVPSGIALDLGAGKMYWADWDAGKIQRADLDGSNVEDLVSGLSAPYGIALDLSNGKMYWTNVGIPWEPDGSIQRAALDGSNVENLITTAVASPYGIALDIASGMMYWADSGIHRASMNGSSPERVVSAGDRPRYVALDLNAAKVYWTTVFFKIGVIERANLDGTDVEDFISTTGELGGPAIEGLALDLSVGKLYWSQWDGTIHRVDLDRANRELIITSSGTALGIALDVREPIPTVSVWGMVVLTLLLLAGGSMVIRRARTPKRAT